MTAAVSSPCRGVKVREKMAAMRIDLRSALAGLPLPATPAWPGGVWDHAVFDHGQMSLVIFAPRGEDHQTTHAQDEVYIVVRGSGKLLMEEVELAFVAGDALFVPAETRHRFVDFSEDFVTWAIFCGPLGGEKPL